MPSTFILPDLCNEWPFKATLNPHHEAASAASVEWVDSFRPFNDKAQAAFDRCKFPLAASLAYSHADPTHLRLACDLMNWFFVFDELSDVKDGPSTRALAANLIDILRDPSKPSSSKQSVLEEMTRCFWSRVLAYSRPSSARRLFESLCPYIEGVCQEAEDREHGHVRSIDDYLTLRRNSAGTRPCFDFIMLPVDIPQDVIMDPHVECLTRSAIDVFILVNDLCSYSFERSLGLDGHNIVTAVMKEKKIDVQGAIDYIGEMFREIAMKFVEDTKDIPSFSPTLDPIVTHYVSGLADCVAAVIEWSFASERYFGTKGPEIKLTRTVKLRSKGEEFS